MAKIDTYIIGSADTADIVVKEEGISRRHAQLTITEGGLCLLADLDSTNGTSVLRKGSWKDVLKEEIVEKDDIVLLGLEYQTTIKDLLSKVKVKKEPLPPRQKPRSDQQPPPQRSIAERILSETKTVISKTATRISQTVHDHPVAVVSSTTPFVVLSILIGVLFIVNPVTIFQTKLIWDASQKNDGWQCKKDLLNNPLDILGINHLACKIRGINCLRCKDGKVDFSNMDISIREAMPIIKKVMEDNYTGEQMVITSARDDAEPRVENSLHNCGKAIDLRSKDFTPEVRKEIVKDLNRELKRSSFLKKRRSRSKCYRDKYDVVPEGRNQPHIHIEYDDQSCSGVFCPKKGRG